MFNIIDCSDVDIVDGKIGYLNFIDIDSLTMDRGSEIRYLNKFRYLRKVTIGQKSIIVSKNSISGTKHSNSPFKLYEKFTMGSYSRIQRGHSFDVTDEIEIGNNVGFAGSGIQVWTHGFDLSCVRTQSPIIIGNNITVGSRSIITPGVRICDNVSIGCGTIVSKSISQSGFYVSSQLVRKGDVPDYSKSQSVKEYEGALFSRK